MRFKVALVDELHGLGTQTTVCFKDKRRKLHTKGHDHAAVVCVLLRFSGLSRTESATSCCNHHGPNLVVLVGVAM